MTLIQGCIYAAHDKSYPAKSIQHLCAQTTYQWSAVLIFKPVLALFINEYFNIRKVILQ
jgi:hypothetical protein